MGRLLILFILFGTINGLHLEGVWKPSGGYRFLTKFGFQRTQIDDLEASRGYVYGTSRILLDDRFGHNTSSPLGTLVLVDSEFILGLYANATEPFWPHNIPGLDANESQWRLETERCRRMFAQIDAIAWHRTCAPTGRFDLLRSVPCPTEGFCLEEDDPHRVLPNSQFTYVVQDMRQPRYWYLSLAACVRNPVTCQWETTRVAPPNSSSDLSDRELSYSIWLVNGAPQLQSYNKFEHQFSFEAHDTLEIFLIIMFLYLLLIAIAHIKLHTHYSVHSHLLLASLWVSCLGLVFTTVHLGVFSSNGKGLRHLSTFGTFSIQWADALFLALLLSTAEVGFRPPSVISQQISHSGSKARRRSAGTRTYIYEPLTSRNQHGPTSSSSAPPKFGQSTRPWLYFAGLILLFLAMQTLLYAWAAIDRDPVIDFSVWNTVPGCLLLAVRFAVAFWFLAILRRRKLYVDLNNRANEEDGDILLGPGIDLIHFAAFFLLWMLILPLVVFVAETSVSPLWRRKTIASVCLSANYIAASVYTYLLVRCCQANQSSF